MLHALVVCQLLGCFGDGVQHTIMCDVFEVVPLDLLPDLPDEAKRKVAAVLQRLQERGRLGLGENLLLRFSEASDDDVQVVPESSESGSDGGAEVDGLDSTIVVLEVWVTVVSHHRSVRAILVVDHTRGGHLPTTTILGHVDEEAKFRFIVTTVSLLDVDREVEQGDSHCESVVVIHVFEVREADDVVVREGGKKRVDDVVIPRCLMGHRENGEEPVAVRCYPVAQHSLAFVQVAETLVEDGRVESAWVVHVEPKVHPDGGTQLLDRKSVELFAFTGAHVPDVEFEVADLELSVGEHLEVVEVDCSGVDCLRPLGQMGCDVDKLRLFTFYYSCHETSMPHYTPGIMGGRILVNDASLSSSLVFPFLQSSSGSLPPE